MTTITQLQTAASFILDGVEYNCQVTNMEYRPTSRATGETIEVACADGQVNVPGDHQDGSASFEVFGDTTDQGITWAMASAQANDSTMTYTFIFFSDQDNTVAMKYTGDCKVQNFSIGWEGKSYHQHSVELVVLSSDGPTRPGV